MTTLNRTLSIAIMSGKGGVGKTNTTLNLSYCLYKSNYSLLLIDCDLNLANLNILLGLVPAYNIQEFLKSNINPQDIALAIEPGGFDFVPAASGVSELIELDIEKCFTVMKRLLPIFNRYDYLFLDLGAGISQTVLSFAAMSYLRIVIITPEPTSLTDSYAIIKILATQWNIKEFFVIVNMANTKRDAIMIFRSLNATCMRFLGFSITFLGAIHYDYSIVEAVRQQIPLIKYAPNAKSSQDIFNIASKLDRLRRDILPTIAFLPVINFFIRSE